MSTRILLWALFIVGVFFTVIATVLANNGATFMLVLTSFVSGAFYGMSIPALVNSYLTKKEDEYYDVP
jgi:hypothetical protein